MAYQDPEVDIKQMQNQRYKIEDIDLDIIDWIKKIRSLPPETQVPVVDAIVACLANNADLFTSDMPKALQDEVIDLTRFWTKKKGQQKATTIYSALHGTMMKIKIQAAKWRYGFYKLSPEHQDYADRQAICRAYINGRVFKEDYSVAEIRKAFLSNLESAIYTRRMVENEVMENDSVKVTGANIAWRQANIFKDIVNGDINQIGNFIMFYRNRQKVMGYQR